MREIYARMISERQQIAERFRSEGAGEAARILETRKRIFEIESRPQDHSGNPGTGGRRSHSDLRRSLQSVPGIRCLFRVPENP